MSPSSPTSASDDIKGMEARNSQRFCRLEAMLLAKTVQQLPVNQCFNRVTIPVSPLKQPDGVVTSERPFIQPTGSASQTSSSQPATSTSEMPVLQSTGLVSHMISSQIPTGKQVLPTASFVGTAAQQDPNSDLEQHIYPHLSCHPMEEEGIVSDQEIGMPEQELDQQLSEEQNYWETVRDVQSFMGWHQVPEF